ncbi:hypothetical protein DI487_00215 [Flavobacterium sediminis]|uniref:DUF1579 domain-containing protein n=1 Tax=Flavobacterium sediminis TaxID=2201181 RepID=A0A2U8QRI2_9FLAO|nr:DUF1579 domain-containing protein [Flavobacterium sediminis]AWM12454.1 hypothetical protein DI487_00215 [Flavobacterium sediminis]
MKKAFVPVLLAALTLVACKKEEPKADKKTATETETVVEEAVTEQPDSATVTKAWEVYMTPSNAHHMMAKDAGTWDADLTFWMPDNPEPQKSTSQAEYKMILDGRYQECIHTGNMWGMPFEGRSITAFDNATEEFISTWIDNMGTGLMVTRGKYDETTKQLTMFGTMVDPISKKEKKVKEVVTYIDDNNQKMEMFEVSDDGKEFKTMEILSKRKM